MASVAEVFPHDPQAQLNYGRALHKDGRVEEAIKEYEFAISRNSSVAEAEFFLGLAWSDLGDEERAARTSPPRGIATPPEGQATPAERGADDIEQFNSWLQGLKQR